MPYQPSEPCANLVLFLPNPPSPSLFLGASNKSLKGSPAPSGKQKQQFLQLHNHRTMNLSRHYTRSVPTPIAQSQFLPT